MLGLAARYADIWNEAWFGPIDRRWRDLRRDVDAACVAAGRDPATLERTVGVAVRMPDLLGGHGGSIDAPDANVLSGDREAIAAGIAEYAADGTSLLIAALQPKTPAAVERLAEAAGIAGVTLAS
jgi:alkanesulfonate monooxygenase SsuD/methylene tetrahydromethanopterin reductase-like flavin-dependent oxidoreductase (luciferase family)